MTGYVRVDTSNNIADGNVISSSDLDNEFDGVVAAFNASTGHTHGGAAGEGAPITKLGPTQDVTASAVLLAPKTTNTVDLGSSLLKYKDLWLAGNASIAGTTTLSSALTYGGVTLSNAVTGTGDMVLSNSPTLVTPALGTPASGVVTNLTGTASININGTVGATTATTGAFTTLTTSSTVTLNGGTANGVPYLNGSKVLTSGSALTFDGTNFALGTGGTSGGFPFTQRVAASGSPVSALRITNSSDSTFDVTLQTSLASIGNGIGSLAFLQAGSEGMRLTSTGLGIGTSSISFASGRGVHINAPTGQDTRLKLTNADSGTGAYDGFDIGLAVTGAVNFIGWEAQPMSFFTSGTERMRLDSSGNLGLGVTPSAWSTNRKAVQIGGTVAALGLAAQYSEIAHNAISTVGGPQYATSNPAAIVDFNNSSAGGFAWRIAPSGTAGNAISFTQAMTLDASGNLLVGTTSLSVPAGYSPKLNVVGSNSAFFKSNAPGAVVTGFQVAQNDNYAAAMYNASTSLVGGIIVGASTTTYATSSDHRLKTVLGPVVNAGQRIDALEPIEYEWKVNGERTRGFLAHKFQEVYAGSVTGTKDAVDAEGKPVYQAMQASSSEVIADLVAEIQSLRKRLAALESK